MVILYMQFFVPAVIKININLDNVLYLNSF